MQPCKGAIAVCGRGRVGLITKPLPERTVRDGAPRDAWHGVTIWPIEFFGKPWQSLAPEVLAVLEDRRRKTPVNPPSPKILPPYLPSPESPDAPETIAPGVDSFSGGTSAT